MPIIIPTPSLEKLKKFPSQAFIVILIILLSYFINLYNKSSKENNEAWKVRALKAERKNDSMSNVMSNYKDAIIQKDEELIFYKHGAEKIDSAKLVIKKKAKKIKK